MSRSLAFSIQDGLLKRVGSRFGELPRLRLDIQKNPSLFKSIAQWVDQSFAGFIREFSSTLHRGEQDRFESAIHNPLFCRRIKETVLEEVYSERLCPRLDILPEVSPFPYPVEDHSAENETSINAFFFEQIPNICNELYPLLIDSYVYNLSHAGQSLQRHSPQVWIGVHTDWMNEDLRATRCIYYQAESDRLIESEASEPIDLHRVQFLALTPHSHRVWSERFARRNILQLNSYPIADRADDKYGCYRSWKETGVPTPEAIWLPQHSIADLQTWMTPLHNFFQTQYGNEAESQATLVVQPNRGTEGRGVEAFRGSTDWKEFIRENATLFDTIREIAVQDDVLIRRGIGNVLFNDPHSGQLVQFDLRANVIRGQMESGFLMVANPGAVISSPGRGGYILEWKPGAEWELYFTEENRWIRWDQALWDEIRRVGVLAARSIGECPLTGVDVRLHWQGGKMIPYVLDINPRPAGLAHSRFFDTREPGVTRSLWDFLTT